jgi:Uma2 family endonuclease
MSETGIIGPEERVELLDGELITMPRPSPEHVSCVRQLTRFFYRTVADRASITAEGVITLDPISQPQPDIMLTIASDREWTAHPTPDDALLVVEVAKSSLSFDRGKKLRAYARCGVREYWIVNLVDDRIEVYGNPRRDRYGKHTVVRRGETLAPKAFPDAVVLADQILPPAGRM